MKFFLIFFLSIVNLLAITTVDIQKAYQKEDYQAVLGMIQRYPSMFQGARESALAAQTFWQVKQPDQSARYCAMSIKIQQNKFCAKLLAKIQKDFPSDYESGIGEYWLDKQQYPNALVKFYKAFLLDE